MLRIGGSGVGVVVIVVTALSLTVAAQSSHVVSTTLVKIVPLTTSLFTVTTRVNSSEPEAARLASDHVTMSLLSVPPSVETTVTLLGNVSVINTFVASPPVLLTVIV